MRKKIVYSIVLSIILLGAFGVAAQVQGVDAYATIYIRANGDVEGTDKILRDGDTYTFTDEIIDSIVVQKSDIIIDGNGYKLQGTGSWGVPGLNLKNVGNVTIKNTNIDYFVVGIYLDSVSHATISGNNITRGLAVGIDVSNSFYNTISGNLAASGGYGVNIQYSGGNIVTGNNITSNTVYGVKLAKSSFNNTVAMNIMANNYFGVHVDTGSFNNTISGNNLVDNTGYGIVLHDSSNNDVHGNDLTNNLSFGVYLEDAFNNVVSGNAIAASNCGIYLEDSSNNTISVDNVSTNNVYGVQLLRSLNNTICGNNIMSNSVGFLLSQCSNNRIYGNNVTNNQVYGIDIQSSSDNHIYENNFVNNTCQSRCSADSVNTWDNGNPYCGNYWSDYTGVDLYWGPCQNETGSDGIGDTFYIINVNNRDNYPLMSPYEYWRNPTPGDINKDMTVDSRDLSQIATAYGSCTERPNWNPNCDINGDGEVTVLDLFSLGKNYG